MTIKIEILDELIKDYKNPKTYWVRTACSNN